MTRDLLLSALYVAAICVFVLGVIGLVAQARFEYRKRTARRDIDRIVQRRGLK